MTAALHLPARSTAEGSYATVVTPESAGWSYTGLRVLELPGPGSHRFATGDEEYLVLPLEGGCRVGCGDEEFILRGRRSPFAGPTDFAYLPRGAEAVLTSTAGGRYALASARCGRALPARRQPAAATPVEARGSGSCARQVVNYCLPQTFDADRLLVCEVLTPGGNWSSYPPHKHDEYRPGEESELEEIYYYEVALAPHGGPGSAYQRVYGTLDRPVDLLAEVATGDVVLVPHGWHGPSMAAPGYDLYYLNVMAGPGPERAWLACDDPAHAWVRGTWPAGGSGAAGGAAEADPAAGPAGAADAGEADR